MDDKHLKAIARELRLIRIELQKLTPQEIEAEEIRPMIWDDIKAQAGDRVTIK